ncbi:MAG TPA: DUF4350 domain-containing protein [Acidimicrobiales bacterium]|nr:DUF4350 domain-containing protein [Acidimicrobiales bacterium]
MTTSAPPVAPATPDRRRQVLAWAAVVAVVIAGVVVVGPPPSPGAPLDPSSTGPLGTRALVLLLQDLGASVAIGGSAPVAGDDVALVLDDGLDDAARAGLGRWVDAGGTLVVADPSSPLHPFPVEGSPLSTVQGRFDSTCEVPALAPVDEVSPPAGSVGFGPVPGAEGCFRRDGAALVAVAEQGSGAVVAVGGAGLFTNRAIGEPGNAVLVAALLAPRSNTSVRLVGTSAPRGGQVGLADLVSDNVKAALVQAALAFGAYLLWRSRRLGSPVSEPRVVTLAASELVVARGHLLQQGGHHDHAARLVSDDLRRRLAERLGLGADAPAGQVAAMAAARSGLPVEQVRSIITPPPLSGPDDLVRHTAAVESMHAEVVRG